MITIIAKINCDFYESFLNALHCKLLSNQEVKYVKYMHKIKDLINKYSYENDCVPLFVIIGSYLYEGGFKTETDSVISELTKRKKTVVIKLTTDTKNMDIDQLIFPEDPDNFDTIVKLLKSKNIGSLVSSKNTDAIKIKINKIIASKKAILTNVS